MATPGEYMVLLHKFVSEYGDEYGIFCIGIFGSVAHDQQTGDSDVDILIEAPVLEELLGAPVDIVSKTEYMPSLLKTRVEKEVVYV